MESVEVANLLVKLSKKREERLKHDEVPLIYAAAYKLLLCKQAALSSQGSSNQKEQLQDLYEHVKKYQTAFRKTPREEKLIPLVDHLRLMRRRLVESGRRAEAMALPHPGQYILQLYGDVSEMNRLEKFITKKRLRNVVFCKEYSGSISYPSPREISNCEKAQLLRGDLLITKVFTRLRRNRTYQWIVLLQNSVDTIKIHSPFIKRLQRAQPKVLQRTYYTIECSYGTALCQEKQVQIVKWHGFHALDLLVI